MSATNSQTTVPMVQRSINIDYKTSQRAKKAAKKQQKAASTVFVEDQPKASHIIGSKADFEAMTAERPAPPPHAMKTPVLSLDDLADPDVIIPDVDQEEVAPQVAFKPAPSPKPLTKSFAGVVGPSSSLKVTVMRPKQVAASSNAVPGQKRVLSGSSSSSRLPSSLSSASSATTSRLASSFATMAKGNPYTTLNATTESPEPSVLPTEGEKDFPQLSHILPKKQPPRVVASATLAPESDAAGFTTVAKKKSARLPDVEPVPTAKKAKAKTVARRPVAPSNDTKFTFVRPNDYMNASSEHTSTAPTEKLDVTRADMLPSLEQATDAIEESGGWTTAYSKKQPKIAKPVDAMAAPSAPISQPAAKSSQKAKKPLIPAPTADKIKLKAELEVSHPPGWTKVENKTSKTISSMPPKITTTKQPVNAFEKLNRTTKLASSSVSCTKKPQITSASTAITAPIVPPSSSVAPTSGATDAQTPNRKKLTRSQRMKVSKEKARKQAVKPASTTISVAPAEPGTTATHDEVATDSSTAIEEAIVSGDDNVEIYVETTFVPSTTPSLDGTSELCSTEEADSSIVTDETEDTIGSPVLSTTGEPCEDANTAANDAPVSVTDPAFIPVTAVITKVGYIHMLVAKVGIWAGQHMKNEMTPSRFCLQHDFDDIEEEEELGTGKSIDDENISASEDAETPSFTLVDIEMTQSRFFLQHGLEDLKDDQPKIDHHNDIVHSAIGNGDGTTPGNSADIEMNASRFCLQYGFDDTDDKNELQVETIIDISKTDAVAFDVMESRFYLHHGCDDDGEEIDEISMDDEPVLEVGLLQLCHIALIEVAIHHEANDKLSVNKMQALQQVKMYGRELSTFELARTKDIVNEHKANTTNGIDSDNFDENDIILEPEQDTEHAATNTDLHDGQQQDPAAEPEIELDGTISPRMTIYDATTHQAYMGLIPVTDFLERLTHEDVDDGKYTKRQVVRVFAAMSNRERELCNMGPVNNSTKEILRSTSLQYTTRIGRTKMIDLLARVGFENDVATTEMVAEACMTAAHEELAFRMSPAGRKVARAIALYASRT